MANRRVSKSLVKLEDVQPKMVGGRHPAPLKGNESLVPAEDNEAPKCEFHVENGRIVATCESVEEWDKLAVIIDEQPIIGRIQAKAVLEEADGQESV